MKAWIVGAAAMLAAGSAQAEIEVISATIDRDSGVSGSYQVEVVSHYAEAVSKLDFRVIVKTPERQVPWADKSYTTPIPGGIEPDETYTINGNAPHEILGSEGHELVIEVVPLTAYGADGEPLE